MIAIAATAAATGKPGAANAAIAADGGVKVAVKVAVKAVAATDAGASANIANVAQKDATTTADRNATGKAGARIIAATIVDTIIATIDVVTTIAATTGVIIIAMIGDATIIGARADVMTTAGIIGGMIGVIGDIAAMGRIDRRVIMVTAQGRAMATAISALSTASSITIRAMTRLGGSW